MSESTPSTATPKRFPVIEIFGPTLQGEGEMIGRSTHFVRFGGCSYRCSWCDTMYAVDPKQVKANSEMLSSDVIASRLYNRTPAHWVTFSGGDPVLHDLDPVVSDVHTLGLRIAVETQGAIWRDWLKRVDVVTVSPKGPSAETTPTSWDMLRQYDAFLERKWNAKIVVKNEEDFEFAREVRSKFPYQKMTLQTCTHVDDAGLLSPIDIKLNILQQMRWLANLVHNNPDMLDVRVLPQMHVLMWGQEQGR